MRSCVASLAAALAFGFLFRMTNIIQYFVAMRTAAFATRSITGIPRDITRQWA
jgi:hypothetical protein